MRHRYRFLTIIGCTCGLLLAKAEESPSNPWELASRMLFDDARNAFEVARESVPTDETVSLGWAVARLNEPPVTRARIEQVRSTLEPLSASADATIAQTARYLLARIAHTRENVSSLDEVYRDYLEIHEERPTSPLGQLAGAHAIIIDLTRKGASQADREQAFEHWSERAFRFDSPEDARHLHQSLAKLGWHYKIENEKLIPHIEAFLESGVVTKRLRRDLEARSAWLTHESGDYPTALQRYQRFIDNNPDDARVKIMSERLAEVSALLAQASRS